MHDKIRDFYTDPQFVSDVMKPMQIDSIIDQDVSITPELPVIPFQIETSTILNLNLNHNDNKSSLHL